ncbi:DUF6215 domain-containing protein [Streptomyces graminilatus]|uniref:DUF6215 domain-containing protein n=1 Tax=Streptomyces graminilatus TaxID=1464070 RepID=UPI0006E1C29C|nr:DUF6215 domain-containing protein [Streptomyces graminilatus]
MSNDIGTDVPRSEKGMSNGVQVASALILVGGLAVSFWVLQTYQPDSQANPPASCSRSDDDKPLSKPVSGVRLCEALNRPDLPALLGTPEDRALGAYSNEATHSDKPDVLPTDPEATVQLEGYSVKLSAIGDDGPSLAEMAEFQYLVRDQERRTVLGHSALLYSGQTIGIVFKDGKGSSGPGGVSRSLVVAKGAEDRGGAYEIDIWRQDDLVPDDTALLRVAERVLPTIPGW